MNRLLGEGVVAPEALEKMRSSRFNFPPDTRWAVYQNHDLGHPDLGHLMFLAVGPENTFPEAPERMPDSPTVIGWRYVHVGWVNLETGRIENE